jgi:rSAM/selenodomain-associated transferase 1
VVIFTKPAKSGRVKTRLVGKITGEQAAELHLAFLGDLGEGLLRGIFSLRVAWALTTDEALTPTDHSFDPEGLFSSTEHFRQVGDGLGHRLHAALNAAAGDYEFVAAVGSDHPELDADTVEEGFRRLEQGADVVLGPSEDGGYYMIGLRRQALHAALFEDIPWSSEQVLPSTLERCRALGLETALLALGRDIDTPADLAALSDRLAAPETAPCPRTRAWLLAHGHLSGGQSCES